MTHKSNIAVIMPTGNCPGTTAPEIRRQQQREIRMTKDDAKEKKSLLYWFTLGIIFASFFAVALT